MAKSVANAGVAPSVAEKILPLPPYQLTLDERSALRATFESEAFRKAWHNAKLSAPHAFPPGDLIGATAGTLALNTLHRMQGWRLFEVALLKQIHDPVIITKRVEDTYPESGMNIVDPRTLPQPPPPPPVPLYQNPSKKS